MCKICLDYYFFMSISYQGPKTIDFITVVINFLVTQDFGAGRKFNMFSLVLVNLQPNCTPGISSIETLH